MCFKDNTITFLSTDEILIEKLLSIYSHPEQVQKFACDKCSINSKEDKTTCNKCIMSSVKTKLTKKEESLMKDKKHLFDFTIEKENNFTSADVYIDNEEKSNLYLQTRVDDANKLISEIVANNGMTQYIVLSKPLISESGEIIGTEQKNNEVIVFRSAKCTLAYILAKYW